VRSNRWDYVLENGCFRPKGVFGLSALEVRSRLNSDIQKLRLIFCTRYKRSFAKQCTQ
jgi:hypothetical protein